MADDIIRQAIEAVPRLYTDPAIRRFDPELERQLAGKNSLFQGNLNGSGRARWLVSFPGQRGDWALNKSGLLYLRTALEESKIAAGIVVLRRQRPAGRRGLGRGPSDRLARPRQWGVLLGGR